MKLHNCFQIQTPGGAQAKIHGDSNMLPKTREALAELIDAAMESVPGAVATGSRGSSPTVREGVETLTAVQIKWAMNAWSRVCQHRISETKVREYAAQHGWAKLEEELKYWLRMSRRQPSSL